MRYDSNRHHRRSVRLQSYDYTQPGAYFVTICIQRRECILGGVEDGRMRLSSFGDIAEACWQDLPSHYPVVTLQVFVVMPNHMHGVIALRHVGAGLKPAPTDGQAAPAKPRTHGLPEIVRAFKTFSARRINTLRRTPGAPVWQRGYYDRVIRNEKEMRRVQEYIVNNPAQWALDPENPFLTQEISA